MEAKKIINEKFSKHLREVLKRSFSLAESARHHSIEPAHFLIAIAKTRGALAAELLIRTKFDAAGLEAHLTTTLPVTPKPSPAKLSARSKKHLMKAATMAYQANHSYVGTEHILRSIIDDPGPELENFARRSNWKSSTLKEQLDMIFKSNSKLPEITETFTGEADIIIAERDTDDLPQSTRGFGIHLTNPEEAKNLDPVIGREKEIERLMQILMRRTKNNPVLLGDPGVGKTAIVEGLAKRIVQGRVPLALKGKKILSLDVGSLVAGTMFRGEFEQRMRQLIDELKQSKDVIVFIDELHTIVGAGAASGSVDAANLLKPALARGEIRCIGATTLKEYRQHIESDGALERRFQPIMVEEPTAAEARLILNGLKSYYESHHNVNLSDEALDAAVQLSERYLPDRFLPDKAIDLIDEAAARVNITTTPPVEEQRLMDIKQAEQLATKRKEAATSREHFEEAIHWREEAKKHHAKRHELETILRDNPPLRSSVGRQTVINILTSWTKVPINDLMSSEQTILSSLPKRLGQKFIGHPDVKKTVADSLRRAHLGIADERRPLASFLLVGPSGVGKTTLAKSIAHVLFGDESSLLSFDMSEYSESFTVSKLIGAPAGYVGYKESGLLTEQIRRKPYQVVLFDEIDRAHRDVYQLLLQILAEGSLRDASGRLINFKQTIIIATANPLKNAMTELGFEGSNDSANNERYRARILDATQNLLPIELQQRFDAILPMAPLSKKDLTELLELELDLLNTRLKSQKIMVKLSKSARARLLKETEVGEGGARALQRTIKVRVENLLVNRLMDNKTQSAKIFILRYNISGGWKLT